MITSKRVPPRWLVNVRPVFIARAWTKSEARARAKAATGVPRKGRLPAGTETERLDPMPPRKVA